MDIRKGSKSFSSIINFTPELWRVISDYINADYDKYDISIKTDDDEVIESSDADQAFEVISRYKDAIDGIKIMALKGESIFIMKFSNNTAYRCFTLSINAAVEKEMAKRLNAFGKTVQEVSGAREEIQYYSSLLLTVGIIMVANNLSDTYFPEKRMLAYALVSLPVFALSMIMRSFSYPKIIKKEESEKLIRFWSDGEQKRKTPFPYYKKVSIIENIAGVVLLVASFFIGMP